MNNSKIYWESLYSNRKYRQSQYDNWLNKYLPALSSADAIIDLGCGDGVNSLFLLENGVKNIICACDFSEAAIKHFKNKAPYIQTMCFDMSNGLPFRNASADVVIADLSLHYFNWTVTQNIVIEIFRVLSFGGLLLCRVNSEDEHIDCSNEKLIEPGYYFNGENHKRYFTQLDILKLFSSNRLLLIDNSVTTKYGNVQNLWEMLVERK